MKMNNMKQLSLFAVAGAACLALSSCGIYNKYQSEASVPTDAYGTSTLMAEAEAATSLQEMSWREFFTDPLLQQLIDTALVRNTDLYAAAIAVEQANVALSTAKLAYLPSLYLAPSATLSNNDNNKLIKGYQLPMQIDWQLDVFGSLTNQKRQSAAVLEQVKAQEEATRANIVSAVAQQYNLLQILDRQLDILLTTEKLWAASLDTQRALMENGKAYSTAVNQMEASYLSVKTQLVDVRRNIQSTENAICRLLSMTPQHIERTPWGAYHLPDKLGTGVPALMLTNRADVKAAERALEAAYYNTNAARSAFYPSLSLSGLGGWMYQEGSIDPAKLMYQAMAQLVQPVFAKGKLRANLKISKLNEEEISKRYMQTILDAGSQVNEAMADCQAALEKDGYYKQQVVALQKAYDGTHELMNNGKAIYLEVLTAQEALLEAQLAEAMNLYNGSQAIIALYVALGGATK